MTSVVVTNGVRGVGLAVARAFAAMPNANILLHHRHDEPANDVAGAVDTVRRVMKGNGRVLSAPADVGTSTGAESLVTEAGKAFGRLDVMVSNASHMQLSMVEKVTDADWADTIHTNLTSTFFVNRAVVPGMRERGFGRIINLVSVEALCGSDVAAAFAASKHGVVGLTKSMALELAVTGVTANCVCPGLVEGPELQRRIEFRMSLTGEEEAEARQAVIEETMPTMRLVDVDEVGAACIYLALPSSKSVTGTVLTLDGGMSAR
uniref:3-oxoacyl-[acyl-carrier-protein] reductase n=1 Tax=Neobodo designis TaxID=312471 RepID=A0A7S1M230_NEODS